VIVTSHPLIHEIVVLAFAGLLIWAALSDARNYLIPNRISLAITALYPAHVLASGAEVAFLPALLVGAAMLALGIVLFSRGLLGGGDVKLMASISLWAGTALVLPFIFATAIAGGILSLVLLLRVRIGAFGGSAAITHTPVPYGIAVSAGGLFVAARLLGSA
jgi:prepilin peptidase CpaA